MAQSKKMFNLFSVSEARNVIFGLATLWIGLFHSDNLSMATYTGSGFFDSVFRFFRGTGNVGVDMFLFLSGVGLFFSFTKDSHVLRFWKKRLIRVLPSAILIATFFFSLRYAHGKYDEGLLSYISRMSFVHFFVEGERVFWFISLILLLYLVFPIMYKVIERFRLFGMLALVALVIGFNFALRALSPEVYANIEIALCRIPVFIIGIWAGRFVMEKKQISRLWLLAFLALAIAMLVVLYEYTRIIRVFEPGYTKDMERMYIWLYRYAACPLSISLVMLTSYVCTSLRHRGRGNLLRNFFEFVGMYSLEYYMIYLNINHYIEGIYKTTEQHEIMLYFGSFVVSLALCVVVRKLCDYFIAYMQRKPKDLDKLRRKRSGSHRA